LVGISHDLVDYTSRDLNCGVVDLFFDNCTAYFGTARFGSIVINISGGALEKLLQIA
jgi:hypothetical protein